MADETIAYSLAYNPLEVYSSGNPLSTTPEIGYARQLLKESEDPLAFTATTSSTITIGV